MPKRFLFRFRLQCNAKVTDPSKYSSRGPCECSNSWLQKFYAIGPIFSSSPLFLPCLPPWHFGRSSQCSHGRFPLPLSRTPDLLQICTWLIWEPEWPPYQTRKGMHTLCGSCLLQKNHETLTFLVWCLPKNHQNPPRLYFFLTLSRRFRCL